MGELCMIWECECVFVCVSLCAETKKKNVIGKHKRQLALEMQPDIEEREQEQIIGQYI